MFYSCGSVRSVAHLDPSKHLFKTCFEQKILRLAMWTLNWLWKKSAQDGNVQVMLRKSEEMSNLMKFLMWFYRVAIFVLVLSKSTFLLSWQLALNKASMHMHTHPKFFSAFFFSVGQHLYKVPSDIFVRMKAVFSPHCLNLEVKYNHK